MHSSIMDDGNKLTTAFKSLFSTGPFVLLRCFPEGAAISSSAQCTLSLTSPGKDSQRTWNYGC